MDDQRHLLVLAYAVICFATQAYFHTEGFNITTMLAQFSKGSCE